MDRQSKRFGMTLAVGVPVLVAIALVAFALSVADRLPDPVAVHWSGSGRADGTAPLAGYLAGAFFGIALSGLLVGVLGVLLTGEAGVRRSMVGIGVGLSVAMGGLFAAGLVGQLDRTEALGAPLHLPTLLTGAAVAAAAGMLAGKVYRPVPAPYPRDSQAPAALDHPDRSGAASATVLSSTTTAPVALVAILVGAVVLVTVLGVKLPWPGIPLGLVLLAVAVLFVTARVVVDSQGIRVYAGRIWPMLKRSAEQVLSVEARDIQAMDYGGWGLRVSSAGVGFITRSGPALIVDTTSGRRIYSVESLAKAKAMSSLLLGYRDAVKDENGEPEKPR